MVWLLSICFLLLKLRFGPVKFDLLVAEEELLVQGSDGLFGNLSGEEAHKATVLSMEQAHAFDLSKLFHLLFDHFF